MTAAVVGVLAVAGTLIGVLMALSGARQAEQLGGAVDQVHAAQSAQASLPACAEVFQPGKVIVWADPAAGCRDPDGNVQLGGYQDCADGRVLFSAEGTVGIPDGYGFVGQKYHPLTRHPIGADPGFAKAHQAC